MITRTASTKRKGIAIRNSILSLIIFLIISGEFINAQDKDAGLWTGIELEKGLNKWLDLKGSLEMRRNNNLAFGEKYFGEVGLATRPCNYFEISLYYRYNQRFIPEYGWTSIHRSYTDLKFEYNWHYFTLSERLRLTLDKNPAYFDDPYIEATARPKTQLQYNIRKTPLRIRTAVELFVPISRADGYKTNKSRYILGMVYIINPSMSLRVSHYYERDSYKNKPLNNYIWVIRFNYRL